MSTTDTERYVRITLLTFEGGIWISKKILFREIDRVNGSLDALLLTKKQELKNRHDITRKQFKTVFPVSGANTDIDEWDLPLLIKIVKVLFEHSLPGQVYYDLGEILRIRNEVVCHARQPSVRDQEFVAHWTRLTVTVISLASAIDENTKRFASDLIQRLSSGPLDLQYSIEKVAQLCRNDEHMDHMVESLATLQQRLSEVATGVVDANRKLDDVLAGVLELLRVREADTDEEGSFRVKVPILNNTVVLIGTKEDVVKLAEDVLRNVIQSAIDRVPGQSDDENVRNAVQQFLADVESKGGKAEATDHGSIILKIRCKTLLGLVNLMNFYRINDHRYRCVGIENALSAMFQEELKVELVLPDDTLDVLKTWIDECFSKLSEKISEHEEKEYKRNINLGIKCDSAEAAVGVIKYLKSDESANRLNQIAEAVSEVVGDKIKVDAAPDVEGFSRALALPANDMSMVLRNRKRKAGSKGPAVHPKRPKVLTSGLESAAGSSGSTNQLATLTVPDQLPSTSGSGATGTKQHPFRRGTSTAQDQRHPATVSLPNMNEETKTVKKKVVPKGKGKTAKAKAGATKVDAKKTTVETEEIETREEQAGVKKESEEQAPPKKAPARKTAAKTVAAKGTKSARTKKEKKPPVGVRSTEEEPDEDREEKSEADPDSERATGGEECGPSLKGMSDEYRAPMPDTIQRKPGKPEAAVAPTCDTIHLRWTAAYDTGESFLYQIRYKIMNPSSKWKFYDEQFKESSVMLTNLKSGTTFVFQVRKVTDEDEGDYSDMSDEISTKVSAASRMREFSEIVNPNDALKKRNVPIEEINGTRNAKAKTRKFRLGNPPRVHVDKERTILLVGATGSGKSTLVDGFINYILGVSWEDPYRYTIVDLEAEEREIIHNQALSQTQWITTYCINTLDGSRIDYKLNIIDTPGFGDTRGIDRDKEIVSQLRQLFSSGDEKGVVFLDAVCFLAKAPDARLTPTQKYIFNAILALFGKDIAGNINIMITFADGKAPPVLAALDEAQLPYDEYFQFNNSGLYADNVGANVSTLSPMFWEMGCKSFAAFFEHLKTMQTKSLKQSKEVLQKREQMETTIENISPMVTNGLSKVEEMRTEIRLLEQHKTDIKANKDFTYTVQETRQIKKDLPKGKHTTNCLHCNFTCHKSCSRANNEDKRKCCIMDDLGNCTQCDDKCHWSQHANTPYVFTYKTKTVEQTYADKEEKYRKAAGEKMTVEKVIMRMSEELRALEAAILEKMAIVTECNNTLKQIALRPDPLTVKEHIDILIEGEKQEASAGYKKRIAALEEFRKKANIGQEVQKFVQSLATIKSESSLHVEVEQGGSKTIFGRAFDKVFK